MPTTVYLSTAVGTLFFDNRRSIVSTFSHRNRLNHGYHITRNHLKVFSNPNKMFSNVPTPKLTLVNFSNAGGLFTMLMEK